MPHDHKHEIKNYNRAFTFGVLLNVIFVVIEAGYGIIAGSLALLADAGHNLSDVLSLLLAWGASLLASKKPTRKRTYGFRRVTILASLLSALFLLVTLGGIAWESIGRFFNPEPVQGMVIIVVAGIGVVINSITALLFISGKERDLNIKGAYLHMAADAGVSLGVVIAGIAIMITGWLWLDPAISILIVIIVLIGTWVLLRDAINLSIDAVPRGIDISRIEDYLTSLKNVSCIHDLHVWALSTTETALTAHLVTTKDPMDNTFLLEIQQYLHDQFHIDHTTIQLEKETPDQNCNLNRPECI
ncbi:MAG: cation transporter [Desulfobacterales bacterium]|nr:cation diffusion facilitator family transporter [Deltaproteobacteria bacterium]NNL41128.1 cation transporter [Desulfobacterales bacterium]